MKKPTCQCGTKMDLKTQGQFDTSTWTTTKHRGKKTKIKALSVYQLIYRCGCGKDLRVRGRSKAHALTLAYGMK